MIRYENREINKRVIVAEDLRGSLAEITGYSIIYASNIEKVIDSLLIENENSVLLTVLIIPLAHYQNIYRHLNLIDYSRVFYQMVLVGSEEDLDDQDLDRLYHISDFLPETATEKKLKFVIDKSLSIIEKHFQNEQKKNWYYNRLIDAQRDQEDLINIGKSLSGEKDMEKLLRLILYLSKKITGADAGSIYLVEEDENGKKRLRFKYSHTFSREIPLEEFVMDINKKSIAGYVAATGDVLNIPDAYRLQELAPYSFNPFFDRQHSYISRSMLVVPMKNHLDQIIGVIQLINSKENHNGKKNYDNEAYGIKLETESDFDRYVVTFDDRYNSLLEAIAGQAAISIENNRLINQIQKQFEEFVRASVTAIESRDPATSGHSFRVAQICTEMAKAVNEVNTGYLKEFCFTDNDLKELEFAALLHDFGKVYIDLNIFKKAKKLYPKDLENLKLRLDYLYRYLELAYYAKEIQLVREGLGYNRPFEDELTSLRNEKTAKLTRIIEIKEDLVKLNEPTISDRDPELVLNGILEEIESIECMDITGNRVDIITDIDKTNLKIKRGSLNCDERLEIESHVIETYKFVSKIPWPPEYRRIPEIAMRHHEKIDGSGYPDGLKGKDSTSLQSRIMAIADIYDALTAKDRPYKKSVPIEQVIKILREEAETDKLDSDLVGLFIETKLYARLTPISACSEN